MFFTTVAIIALGIPIIRAFTKRFERGPAAPALPSPEIVARLERIEQAVERSRSKSSASRSRSVSRRSSWPSRRNAVFPTRVP